MGKTFYVLVILVVMFVGLTFTYMNHQVVEIRYLTFSWNVNISVLLLVTLIFGVMIGYLTHFVSTLKIRRNLSSAKKEIKSRESVSL